MFIVASDLSEAQRERLMSALSLQGMDVTAYTFEAVRKVFVKLFCTPKSSMENSSRRVNMRTDAKNLVTTARTSHPPEQKETIHMISMLQKEACSGSIHDLVHIPTQNCLADCLTKSSAKADNLSTAVKTGRLLDVEISLSPTPREGAFHVMFVRTSVVPRVKMLRK